jgi:SAM-dependent methyltransferase
MKLTILDLLRCPECSARLTLPAGATTPAPASEIDEGTLTCEGCAGTYPIVRGIPRFVPASNYAQSFGYQWTKFSRTQLDENFGVGLSEERFVKETRWSSSLAGERILEAGSGMGRFTRCAAATGAEVFSFDYSNAIDANYANNRHLGNVHFVQADIRKPPFAHGAFDKIFCLGVLQHTPDPKQSFMSLLRFVRPGGEFVSDIYRRTWKTLFWGQYYLRPITRRIPPDKLFPIVEKYFNVVHAATGLILPINSHLSKLFSIMLGTADYRGDYPLSPEVMREWCLLDTFDKLSPAFDQPHTIGQVTRWFEGLDVASFEVAPGYNGLEIHVVR